MDDSPSGDIQASIAPFSDIGPLPEIESITEGSLTLRPIYPGLYDRTDGPQPVFLGAFAADGTEAWRVRVYDAPQLIPDLEGDVQEAHFRSMRKTPSGTIMIVSSEQEQYEVDPVSRSVTPHGRINANKPDPDELSLD